MECINTIFIRKSGLHVPCGKCLPCLERRQREWAGRLALSLKVAQSAYFVTLTYNDQYIKDHCKWGHLDQVQEYELSEAMQSDDFSSMQPKLNKSDFQAFLMRLRNFNVRGVVPPGFTKKVPQIAPQGSKMAYFAVGEYGDITKRPHWHMVIFNLNYKLIYAEKVISHAWEKDYKSIGHIHIGPVQAGSLEYVTGYLFKNFKKQCTRLISKGLGTSYVNDEVKEYHRQTLRTYHRVHGTKYPLPRILRDKIFNEFEKREIAEKTADVIQDRDIEDPTWKEREHKRLKRKVEYRNLKRKKQ